MNILVNFIVIAITFSEKKIVDITFVLPLMHALIHAPHNSTFLKYTFYSIVLHFMFMSLFHNEL
jgi:hypothetical protein